jgi:hypothetical protein
MFGIIYIGGSPYEANIVYLKNFQEEEAKFVFLHKDYLGSIITQADKTSLTGANISLVPINKNKNEQKI